MKKLNRFFVSMIVALVALGLAGCSRAADNEDAPAGMLHEYGGDLGRIRYSANMTTADEFVLHTQADSAPSPDFEPMPTAEFVDTATGGGANQVDWEDIAGQGQRHLIQTASTELETEYFYEVVAELRRIAPAAGGYVESEMLSNHGRRMFSIVLRVPAGNFENALIQIESLGEVRFLNQWAQDVTDQFYDMAGNLEIRRIEEDRILGLIENAQTIYELLSLEQRLSNTRLNIEMYLSQLNNMAGQIAYSTISVTLVDISEEERVVLTPSLGERIGGAFGYSVDGTVSAVQNFIVFFAGIVIPLILLGMLGIAVYMVARKVYRKKTI